jgi:DNA mismatch endonuclease (patch repair protein)
VDGCFWHLCPKHGHFPVSRVVFWKRKLTRNAERDRLLNSALKKQGWRILRIWEHELRKKNYPKLLTRLSTQLNELDFIPQTTPAQIVWRRKVANRPAARRGR